MQEAKKMEELPRAMCNELIDVANGHIQKWIAETTPNEKVAFNLLHGCVNFIGNIILSASPKNYFVLTENFTELLREWIVLHHRKTKSN